jgi:hypothetical protein
MPSLLLFLASWSWFFSAVIATSFGVMVIWSHCCSCFFFHGHGNLASLLQWLLSWSWLAPSFCDFFPSRGCFAHRFLHGRGCLAPSLLSLPSSHDYSTPSLLSFISWSQSLDTIVDVVSFMVVVA